MRRLLPPPVEEVVAYDAYRPADPHAPLLRLDMVTSVDGAITRADGRSGGLGGPGDLAVFTALRALADGVVVGAGTARTEGYGPHRVRPELAARRRADGRDAPAAIVVVSRSLELDYDAPLFTAAHTPTVVLTCAAAPADRREAAGRAGRVVVAGDDAVDLTAGIAALRDELGLASLVCEGGPALNAALLDAGLVDELCVTVAPSLVAGGVSGLAGDHARDHDLDLRQVCEQDGELYLRYRVG